MEYFPAKKQRLAEKNTWLSLNADSCTTNSIVLHGDIFKVFRSYFVTFLRIEKFEKCILLNLFHAQRRGRKISRE